MHHSNTLHRSRCLFTLPNRFVHTYKLLLFSLLCCLSITFFSSTQLHAQVGDYLILDDDSYLEVPDNNFLDFNTHLSVEAWINLCDVTSGTHTIVSKSRCNANQSSYSLRIVAGGKLQWRWSENGTCGSAPFDGGLYITNNEVIDEASKWYHIAAVHTPTSVKIYVNGSEVPGTLQSGGYSTIFNSSQPLRIGASIGGPTGIAPINFLNCFIDELRLWDYPLTPAEIAVHAAELPSDPELSGIEPGLTAYYNMSIPPSSPPTPPTLINNIAMISGASLNGSTLGGDADSPLYVPTGIDLNNLELGNNTIVCSGEPFVLDIANVGLHFLWSDNRTDAVRQITEPGTYSVTATLGNCTRADSITVAFEGGIDTVRLQQCGGDPPYLLQGALRYVSGTYYDTIPTGLACDSIRVTLLDIGEFFVIDEEISLCAGEQYELNTGVLVSNAGLYFDTLKQQNGNCDSLIKIIQFKVNDFVLLERIDSICWGESKWLAGQLQTKSGAYSDTVYTVACDTIYQVHLVAYDCRHIGCQIVMPDAFSPNEDGINDRLSILNPCNMRNFRLEVYDRWGRRVFYSQDPQQTWDGKTDNRPCDLGVYGYTTTFEAFDMERGFWRPKTQSGSVVLVR